MKKTLFTLIILLTFASSLSAQKIVVAPGPEDIAVEYSSGKARLIVSCAERRMMKEDGWFYAFDPDGNNIRQLKVNLSGIPKEYYIHPHGIDVKKIGEQTYLYAIIHMKEISDLGKDASHVRNSIVRFIISGDELIADKVFEDPLIKTPNDIIVLDDGSFVIGNCMRGNSSKDRRRALIFGKPDGSLVYFNIKKNKGYLLDEKLKYPNGMIIKDNYFYLACTKSNEIVRYEIKSEESELRLQNKQKYLEVSAPDNLFLDGNSIIFSSIPKPFKYVKHVKSASNFCPGIIFSLDLNNASLNELFHTDGSQISTISGAVKLGNKLFISQVFEPWIYKTYTK